jgi:cell division FtsZ-interacting protein ZapD
LKLEQTKIEPHILKKLTKQKSKLTTQIHKKEIQTNKLKVMGETLNLNSAHLKH